MGEALDGLVRRCRIKVSARLRPGGSQGTYRLRIKANSLSDAQQLLVQAVDLRLGNIRVRHELFNGFPELAKHGLPGCFEVGDARGDGRVEAARHALQNGHVLQVILLSLDAIVQDVVNAAEDSQVFGD